ncbi:hypothetical protein KR50_08180 [Jeotgalibacillus campisalis]|uniref:Uncharacterized protein n=1 Tax=Jeotgalibacillus campisalis TaxID=220754 RepID=A0A0C2VPU6_9BACL|nr:hypothetical protein KR50_08180 [Jeotgalibacillus campisalis]
MDTLLAAALESRRKGNLKEFNAKLLDLVRNSPEDGYLHF